MWRNEFDPYYVNDNCNNLYIILLFYYNYHLNYYSIMLLGYLGLTLNMSVEEDDLIIDEEQILQYSKSENLYDAQELK